MKLTERDLRLVARDVGLSPENRQEVVRILQEDDYTADFPLRGPVTYAIAVVLLSIIDEANFQLKYLPLAISCVDKSIKHVPSNIKRNIDNKVAKIQATPELFCQIDQLYHTKSPSPGPGCNAAQLDWTWLQGDEPLPPDSIITNQTILELLRLLKQHKLPWTSAREWLCRMFPGSECVNLLPQTISTNWVKIQRRANQLRGKKSSAPYLNKQYSPPTPKPVTDSAPPAEQCEEGESSQVNSTPSITDILSRTFDSPVKKTLINHIHKQDKENRELKKENEQYQKLVDTYREKLSKVNTKYSDVVSKYIESKRERKCNEKVNRELKKELAEIEEEERKLRLDLCHKGALINEYQIGRFQSRLQGKDKQIESLKESVKKYKDEMAAERKEMSEQVRKLEEEVEVEKGKKRKQQKRVCYYKNKLKTLEKYDNQEIKELLKDVSSLHLQNDDLECQLEEAVKQPVVTTFEDGKFVDAVRLVVYDFLSRNVGTKHVSSLIRSVLENLAGVDVGRLPKETLVKIMAVEADVISKRQVAKELFNSENVTLHMDATTKKQRHFYSVQISTETRSYSASMLESVSGDTNTQVEITKQFVKELSGLISDQDNQESTECKMLFNIKNTMADRGPTSKSWVEHLQLWREEVIQKNLAEFQHLSDDAVQKLAKINDFYCGKHFLLGLAERTRVGLILWEEEVADVVGQVGMEALPEFQKWNCQKPAGLRLIRTATELVGNGAKEPHGIPEDFKAHLPTGEKNHIPIFEHNRFNILFKAASAVTHHRDQLRDLLLRMQNDNRLHRAVLEDSANSIIISEVVAISLLEKHITTPLATITSRKDHVLDLRKYYVRLREFLQQMTADPTAIIDGSAVLFEDCAPIQDDVWRSIYLEITEDVKVMVEQLVSVLCASYLVVCERQLFDFVHGKWAEQQTEEVYKETASVPRNNDVSERDFAGLDRLLKFKNTANIDFLEGLILYVNNHTSSYLRQLSSEELAQEVNSAMQVARIKTKEIKQKKAALRQARREFVAAKQQRREELKQHRLIQQQKIQDDIQIDGQVKNSEDVDELLQKYHSVTEQKQALTRQLKFYKTLKIPGVPAPKYFKTCQGKDLSVEELNTNLIFIISAWKSAMLVTNNANDESISMDSSSYTSDIQSKGESVNSLKRKLVEEAESERLKKVKKYKTTELQKRTDFPGDGIIGKRVRHRYEVASSGKVMKRWFKGVVLRKATGDELLDITDEDQEIVSQGYTLYMVKYDREEQIEPFALGWDWENGDLELL